MLGLYRSHKSLIYRRDGFSILDKNARGLKVGHPDFTNESYGAFGYDTTTFVLPTTAITDFVVIVDQHCINPLKWNKFTNRNATEVDRPHIIDLRITTSIDKVGMSVHGDVIRVGGLIDYVSKTSIPLLVSVAFFHDIISYDGIVEFWIAKPCI